MRRIVRGDGGAGARVQKIVGHLRAVEGARFDDPLEGFRVADRSDAQKARLSRFFQPLEGRHDLAEDLFGRQRVIAPGERNAIVQLEEIDMVELQPRQARIQRGGDRGADPAFLFRRHAHLGADQHIGLEAFEDAAEIALGLALPVHRRGVEIIDAQFERPRDRALLIGGVALYDQPADRAAAEAEEREAEAALAKHSLFHAALPRCPIESRPAAAGCQSRRGEADSHLAGSEVGQCAAVAVVRGMPRDRC